MSKVVRMNGAPRPVGGVMEETRHYCIIDDGEGSVEFTEEGARIWSALFRKANIHIAYITEVSSLTASIQRACEAIDDETIEVLKQRHSAEELEPVARFLNSGQADKARLLLGGEEPKPNITPVD